LSLVFLCFFSSFRSVFSGIEKEWLTDMEISYTEGPMNLNWKQIMQTVEGDDRFYMDTEEDEVTAKEAGWEFLRMHGKDDDVDEESEEESVYSENSEQEETVSSAFSYFFFLMYA
jgi:nucleosome binding factor SPN SPT16 subunit